MVPDAVWPGALLVDIAPVAAQAPVHLRSIPRIGAVPLQAIVGGRGAQRIRHERRQGQNPAGDARAERGVEARCRSRKHARAPRSACDDEAITVTVVGAVTVTLMETALAPAGMPHLPARTNVREAPPPRAGASAEVESCVPTP